MVWSPFAEFVAWCLAFVLLAFVGFGPLRRDKGAAQAYLVTVVVHIAAAAIYVYIPDVLPAVPTPALSQICRPAAVERR